MSGNPLEDILNSLASMPDCPHCGILYDPDVDGAGCLCCKKPYDGRVLREATMDTARIDYNEIDGSFFDTAQENSPFVEVKSRGKSGKSGKSGKKGKRAPATAAAEAVMTEFENALLADGFAIGANGDGTAMKYSRYMRMLFDHGIFSTRADFFKVGARACAQKFYQSQAEKKALENGGKTSAKKLYRNFANGFDKFVLLCADASIESETTCPQKPVEEDVMDTAWIEDLLCVDANIESEITCPQKPVEEDVMDTAWIDDLLDELGIELCE